MTSTEAQNNFGEVLDRVEREGRVFITRYHRPRAVVLSIREYATLTHEEPVDLGALERDFDALAEAMQGAAHGCGVDALFGMSAEALGAAAAAEGAGSED